MRPILLALATLALAAQDERAFLDSMARLEKQDPAGKKDLETGSPLRAAALAMDPAREPEKARYAAASWLWATSLIRGLDHPVDGTYLKAARGQAELQKAWTLLETVGGDLTRPRNAMRLEIAWRLLDPDRMKQAYATVAAQPTLNPRELIHCFFVAAHLGEWEAMKRHAQAIVAQGGKLENLHANAEDTPAMFDYESLLKAVEAGRPDRDTGSLAARSFQISKARVKIRRISGHDKTLLKESESWPRDWVTKPDPTAPLLQVGAAAHWVEGPGLPPVSGFMQKDRIYLVGYKIAQGDAPEAGRQDQAWDMRPDSGASGRWHGLNTLTIWRAGVDPKAGPALQVTFDAEWDLRPLETLP